MALAKGSRVFIVDSRNKIRRYGTIVKDDDIDESTSELFDICLDNLHTIQRVPRQSIQGIQLDKAIQHNKAAVSDGALTECSVIGKLFPMLRRLAQHRNHSTPASTPDFEEATKLNQQIVAHWDQHMYRALYTTAPQLLSPSEHSQLTPALSSLRALRSWGLGFQANLWFVARDYDGTYVVPEENKLAVYKIVSVTQPATPKKSPDEPMSMNVVPVCMKTTVVPWFGRLLYDSTVVPPQDTIIRAPNPVVARYLQTLVLKAIKLENVIDTFFELEAIPGNLALASTSSTITG